MYVVEFDSRSDGGPTLVGPFGSKPAGEEYVNGERDKAMKTEGHFDACWSVRPMHVPDRV